jgi:FKBP-type peptidyl-prolyl cis-trans isomerase FklB
MGLQDATLMSQGEPYTIGFVVGNQLSQMLSMFSESVGQDINPTMVLAGIMEVVRNQQTAIEASKANEIVQREMEKGQERANARRDAELRMQFADAIAEGNAFLAENARRPGVTTLPSGLQYEILREGHGAIPVLTSRVRTHYHGTLIDGTVFDSSMDRQTGAPEGSDMSITFGVAQVIAGWTEALQLMPVGSKWRLFIPYDLAYGGQDRGVIAPFSVLIFDVELLGIE